jgi:hypothetical protein
MKMAAKFVPDRVEGLNMNEIIATMKSGCEGKLVDIVDQEKGEHAEIFVE